jgi:hypothetical protein
MGANTALPVYLLWGEGAKRYAVGKLEVANTDTPLDITEKLADLLIDAASEMKKNVIKEREV